MHSLYVVCHPAIIFALFVVRRSFVLSVFLHIRPSSLLPLLPLFFACCCCFFCASPFSFCFPCFSLLFVRALCLFSAAFWRVAVVVSVPRPFRSAFRASRCYLCASFAFFSVAFLACYCCFFCASPFLFCFPCFSLLFVRALCLFFLFLSALFFNNHRKPAICSTAPRTART